MTETAEPFILDLLNKKVTAETVASELLDQVKPIVEMRLQQQKQTQQLQEQIDQFTGNLQNITLELQKLQVSLKELATIKNKNAEQERAVLTKLMDVL